MRKQNQKLHDRVIFANSYSHGGKESVNPGRRDGVLRRQSPRRHPVRRQRFDQERRN